MKTIVSYTSGCAGDFVVNCLNRVFDNDIDRDGTVVPSATIKSFDHDLSAHDLIEKIKHMPCEHIGSHCIDRLNHMPVSRIFWLTIADQHGLDRWIYRDAITRDKDQMMSPHGNIFEITRQYIRHGKHLEASKLYLENLMRFNRTQNAMRLCQSENKIDVSDLLETDGYLALIRQVPALAAVQDAVQHYHSAWLAKQAPLHDRDWVVAKVAEKLGDFHACHRHTHRNML